MQGRDLFIAENGQYQICKSARTWDLLRDNYRLYRFLTELEDVLNNVEDQSTRLPEIRMLVRRLIINSYWVQSQFLQPDLKTGISVLLLYNELGFPLTVQTVTFAPGTNSNIHNHGTWGVVAILKGQEKNTFWRRSSNSDFPNKIEKVGEINLSPGDIVSFTPQTIHQVQAIGEEPTVTFNIYGETNPKQRFEFDITNHSAKKF
ncbi:cupin [Aphanizomenon flos-aquae NRERC-008]|jgi:predicted metal-dependent enzyme (double-stranded beta helix superfamily)|uniref:Cupin n=2 Tax=Aphanizomenon flos-aquae TaxID=1176 RepID=A0A1B7WMS9_APHFL|nr:MULTISPECIES: cupin [Aphanizomenon]MBD1219349.1 cupin [Aphanizomenon flos-aquae Clear-A1]MCE2903580.1 cupin [Anabaena sp. CoA2_C59]MDJ0507198.1 cupin [Nostocales cyanobacterium LE14-WE12]NTW19636.1 cupin [Nostocales cyanobacterium W4_Combined_metabat2_030]OBQ23565.1 MAG: cupin [Anabaena sp. WA113]OBQ38451.1 MAG: cupin [Aphanizomenon flos-aquae WA102]QSV68388.1 MAG: cupin [Aphanizomenon flos-aquae DEX188]